MAPDCRVHHVPGGGTWQLNDPRCHPSIANTAHIAAHGGGVPLLIGSMSILLNILLIFGLFSFSVHAALRHTMSALSARLRGRGRASAIERAEVAEREVRRLSERISELLEERTLLNGVVAKSSASNKGDSGRFHKLRNLIVHELHPDGQANLSQIERLIRAELFKALWPAIQRIESREGD